MIFGGRMKRIGNEFERNSPLDPPLFSQREGEVGSLEKNRMRTEHNIVLIGFMGTGKTSVGRLLAARTGRTFVDSDEFLTEREGRDIPSIFAEDGEAAFRRKERETIALLANRYRQVIATGGGVVLDPQNMADLRRNGVVVGLLARPESVAQRLMEDTDRPLLQGKNRLERVQTLLAEREERYRQADIVIQTDDYETPEDVAEEVIRRLTEFEQRYERRVEVLLGERSYDIHIGSEIGSKLPEILQDKNVTDPLLVVSNPKVADLYLAKIMSGLEKAGRRASVAIVPDGEIYKSLEQAERLYDAAVSAGLERRSAILALGGGVIGDLAGFVAATYLRGIGFIQLPTTLLAQVDSSVGGKVAVNHPHGKNLIGAFYQPLAVLADLATLQTLDAEDFASGLAEVVKSAAIYDQALFEFLEAHVDPINRRDPEIMAEIVERVCHIKAAVVAADEREGGLRAILNYGHTVGHAVEAVTNYTAFRHGEAVAMGMVAAAEMAARMGLCSRSLVERTRGLLQRLKLPIKLPELALSHLKAALYRDKKVDMGEVRFVLPVALGEVRFGLSVPEDILNQALLDLGAVEE